MTTYEFCGMATIVLEEDPPELDAAALDALAADIDALEGPIHFLDDRRHAGLDARRHVTQWPIICRRDLLELDADVRSIPATEDPELVTCDDCRARLAAAEARS